MSERLSKGLTSGTGVFGLAQVKVEGSSVVVDKNASTTVEDGEETYWLEIPLTKKQYAHLADLLESSSEAFARDLGESCRKRAVNGYGGGW
jgi:hypothetical protein